MLKAYLLQVKCFCIISKGQICRVWSGTTVMKLSKRCHHLLIMDGLYKRTACNQCFHLDTLCRKSTLTSSHVNVKTVNPVGVAVSWTNWNTQVVVVVETAYAAIPIIYLQTMMNLCSSECIRNLLNILNIILSITIYYLLVWSDSSAIDIF